jgi:hypothetical protein
MGGIEALQARDFQAQAKTRGQSAMTSLSFSLIFTALTTRSTQSIIFLS